MPYDPEKTTIQLSPEIRLKLKNLKGHWNMNSYEEVIDKLLKHPIMFIGRSNKEKSKWVLGSMPSWIEERTEDETKEIFDIWKEFQIFIVTSTHFRLSFSLKYENDQFKIYMDEEDGIEEMDDVMHHSLKNAFLMPKEKKTNPLELTEEDYQELIALSPPCPNCGQKPFIPSKGCKFCGYKINNNNLH